MLRPSWQQPPVAGEWREDAVSVVDAGDAGACVDVVPAVINQPATAPDRKCAADKLPGRQDGYTAWRPARDTT